MIPAAEITLGAHGATAFASSLVAWSAPRLTSALSPLGVPNETSEELGTMHECGARLGDPRARLQLTTFLSMFRNRVVASGAGLIDGGPSRASGFEASGSVAVGKLLRWPLEVQLNASYALSRALFTAGPYAGNTLPYAPLHALSARVSVEHRAGMAIEIAGFFQSEQLADNALAPDGTGTTGVIPARATSTSRSVTRSPRRACRCASSSRTSPTTSSSTRAARMGYS